MKTVLLILDSLNRSALENYGGTRVATPNFVKLGRRSATFDGHRVGSLPCMPARRDLHTGRLSFLHRSWGPLEPFDESFSEILSKNGVYTHLITDHFHYWEDGGATYHNRYDSYDMVRGQEGDRWRPLPVERTAAANEPFHAMQRSVTPRNKYYHNVANRAERERLGRETGEECIDLAVRFLDDFRNEQNWFLQIEIFDPHEPFDVPAKFREGLDTNYRGPVLDWPPYDRVRESAEEVSELKANYYAAVKYCDDLLGRLLKHFDDNDLWDSVNLIVTTDHGYLLGEHDWWAKNKMPVYEEIAHIPLFLWSPSWKSAAGARISALSQTIDLMPTILGLHGVSVPSTCMGESLLAALKGGKATREAVLYGMFGGSVNVSDGRWIYYRYPASMSDSELYQYTLMPCHMNYRFSLIELKDAELHPGFSFTKEAPVLKIRSSKNTPFHDHHGPGVQQDCKTALFDLQTDPDQEHPIDDPLIERRMVTLLIDLLLRNEAPPEVFTRLGLSGEREEFLTKAR